PDALTIGEEEVDAFLSKYLRLPIMPPTEFPADWSVTCETGRPQPRLMVEVPDVASTQLVARPAFRYEQEDILADDPRTQLKSLAARALVLRDREAEARWRDQLAASRCLEGQPVALSGRVMSLPASL